MPLVAFLIAVLLVFLLVLSTPFLVVIRYRVGVARRPARRWIATIDLASLLISCALFLWIAAMTNFWIPHAFRYSLVGLVTGCLLGFLGLALTRWERTPRALHYTPNRWLILLVKIGRAHV